MLILDYLKHIFVQIFTWVIFTDLHYKYSFLDFIKLADLRK